MAYVPKPTLIFCVDTETGGFNPNITALLTVGCAWLPATELGNPNPDVKSVEYKVMQKPYNLVNNEDVKAPKATSDVFRDNAVPNVVTKGALDTNKINMNDHLAADPAPLVDFKISEQLRVLASQYNIQLLGQNLKFDMRFLQCNLPHTYERLQRLNAHHELRTLITAYNVAKSLNVEDGYGKSTGLDKLRASLNWVSEGQTHSAAVDAVDTIKFYGLILKELSGKLVAPAQPQPQPQPQVSQSSNEPWLNGQMNG